MSKMAFLMHSMRSFASKTSGTKFTLIGFLAGVNIFMIKIRGFVIESFTTNFALVFLLIIRRMLSLYVSVHKFEANQFAALVTGYFFMHRLNMSF